MTLSHVSKSYGSKAARIAPMLTDPAGGTPTYGSSVLVPGIQQVIITGTVDAKELRGDNTLLDADAVLRKIDVTIDWAKFSFDVLNAILGATIVDTGASPNQVTSMDITSPVILPYFKLEVQTASADPVGGDLHFTLWKLKISSFPEMGTALEDYRLQKVAAIAVPRISDGKWISPVENETKVAPV